jgi:hypothetical protein
MPVPALGLTLTYTPSPRDLRGALSLMRADALKVVTGWGVAGGWSPAAVTEVAQMTGELVVRTVYGDPSAGDGRHGYPYANQIVTELRPWLSARPDAVVELGNEPIYTPRALDPYIYAYHLAESIRAVRAAYPLARILAPAFSLNEHTPELTRWYTVLAPQMRACDGVAIHAYSEEQLALGLSLSRRHVGATPAWLTEFALYELLAPVERARRTWQLLRDAPVAAALLYHLDQQNGVPLEAQGPTVYRLDTTTLGALGLRDDAPAPPPRPPRPPVVSLAMTRERLSRGRPMGPPRVLVLHATAGRGPGDLNWLRQGGGDPPLSPVSCHYYIDKSGRITQLVADHDTAWHCGPSRWAVDGQVVEGSYRGVARLNWLAIGIELENRNTGKDPYPAHQLAAAVALARHLVAVHRIPRNQLVRHLDIAPGRKTDPAGLDWGAFVRAVYGEAS